MQMMHVCTSLVHLFSYFFFFNDTATTEIYTLSLHDALPISGFAVTATTAGTPVAAAEAPDQQLYGMQFHPEVLHTEHGMAMLRDRKSTRLNSSHQIISYAVFCLKKKNSKHSNNCQDHDIPPS